MKRLSLLPTSILLAALAPALFASQAGGAVLTPTFHCQVKSASLLFWPHGHGKRPGAGFPEFRTPHLEFYGGIHSTTFPPNTIAYLDSTQRGNTSCVRGGNRNAPPPGRIAHKATVRKAKNVQCHFGVKPILLFSRLSSGAQLDVIKADGTRLVEVQMKPSGSFLSYNTRRCDPKSPPG